MDLWARLKKSSSQIKLVNGDMQAIPGAYWRFLAANDPDIDRCDDSFFRRVIAKKMDVAKVTNNGIYFHTFVKRAQFFQVHIMQ